MTATCPWGLTWRISESSLSLLRDEQQLCSNKKRSPLCLQRFQLILADCALQRPQGTDFQTAASRLRSTALSNVTTSSSTVFLRWVRPRLLTVHFSTGLYFSYWFSVGSTIQVLLYYLYRRNHQPDAGLESTGFVTDFLMLEVKPSETAALSPTTEESCIVVLSIKVIQSIKTIYSLVFFLLIAKDGKPQMHLAQQNATFTHLSCVSTVAAWVFTSSCLQVVTIKN